MTAPSNIERAAQLAAIRVKEMLIAMLTADELGEVAIIVGYSQLEPEKRIIKKGRTIKVARGRAERIEVAE